MPLPASRRPFLLLSLCIAPTAWGQTTAHDGATAPPTELDTVQVQAAHYQARRDDTATRIVIDAAQLRQYGDPALLDALKRLPGISVGQGAPGRSGTLSLRGLGAGYTQILINGQKAPLGFDLDALSPEMVERVEILRAPTADQRTEAIAGTLNIVLVAGARKEAESLALAWGLSNARSAPSLTWQRSRHQAHRSQSVAVSASRRAFLVEQQAVETAYAPEGQPDVLRSSRLRAMGSRQAVSLAPSVELSLDNGDTLTLQALADASRFQRSTDITWDTWLGPPLAQVRYRQHTRIAVEQLSGSAGWTHPFDVGGSFTTRLAAGGNREDYRYREQGVGTDGQQNLDDHTDARLRVHNVNSSGKYALPTHGRHTLEVGWEGSVDGRDEARLQQLRPIAGGAGSISDLAFDARIRRMAVYGQDDLQLGPRWSMYLGLRWETIEIRSAGSGFAAIRQRDSVLSPVLQSLWKLPGTRDDQLRVALSRTYKSPTLASLIPRPYTSTNNRPLNPDEQGNPALRPELATGVDIAYETHGKDGTELSLGAYARRIQDLVRTETTAQDGRWVATPRNAGDATSWGVEMDARVALARFLANAPDVSFRLNATRNWSRVADVPGPDNRLDGQLRFTGSLGADYRINPRWTTGLNYSYRSGGPVRISSGQIDIDAYQRELDLYALWTLGPRTKLRLSANNLLRQDLVSGQVLWDAQGRQQLQQRRSGAPLWRLQWEQQL